MDSENHQSVPGGQAAIETVRSLLTHMLSGEMDEAGKLIAGDAEGLTVPEAGPGETLTFTVGDVEPEGETLLVSAELGTESSEQSDTQSILFVCVQTEEGMRVDMDRTMQKALGFSPDELLEGLKEGVEELASGIDAGVEAETEGEEADEEEAGEEAGEEEEKVEEKSAEAVDPKYDLDLLPDEFKEGLARVEEEVEDELAAIDRALETDMDWGFAWGTMPMDGEAPLRLSRHVLAPVRDAMQSLRYLQLTNSDPRIGSVGALIAKSIRGVHVECSEDEESCGIRLDDEVLWIVVDLRPGNSTEESRRGCSSVEIEQAVRDALDFDYELWIEDAADDVAKFNDRCREGLGFDLAIDVDWDSFRSIGRSEDAKTALERLRRQELDGLYRNLHGLHRDDVLLEGRLGSLRLCHVGTRDERDAFDDGDELVIHLWLTEKSGNYTWFKLGPLLPGLVASLPAADGPAECCEKVGAGGDVDAYSTNRLPCEVAGIRSVLGEEATIGFDFESYAGQEGASGESLVACGLQRVCGALQLLLEKGYGPDHLRPRLTEVSMCTVADPSEVSCGVKEGVLRVAVCPGHGPSGGFTEGEIAQKISDGLWFQTAPRMRELQSNAQVIISRLARTLEAPMRCEFDWASFVDHPDINCVLRGFHTLKDEGLYLLHRALIDVLEDDEIREIAAQRLRGIGFVHVPTPEEKSIVADGQALVLRLYVHEGTDGCLDVDEVAERIPDLLRSMAPADDGYPEPDEPDEVEEEEEPEEVVEEAPESEFDQSVASMEADILPGMREQLEELFGRETPLRIDWESLDGDMDRFNQIVTNTMGNAYGALMGMLYNAAPDKKERLSGAIQEVFLQYDGSIDDVEVALSDGVLKVSAGGSAGEYVYDPNPMIKRITELLP